MANLSLRGVEAETLAALKARARAEGASVNSVVLKLISEGLGIAQARTRVPRHTDLDELAGAWSADEAAEFAAATSPFDEVDEGLWK
ncbi:MAG: hypothetical protein KF778_01745 [Rhodocyclaceae bacterium]|nr:hypothetical protein [Rhodocyclaceae bacterium]MBX3667097.1 hypothetical protein [Rhodocyclaceae bacterium]